MQRKGLNYWKSEILQEGRWIKKGAVPFKARTP